HYSVIIGDNVTVGHQCIIHGCTIGDNTLIGMGTIIMDGAEIGSNCIIGAGSLVTAGVKIPDGQMAFGQPAKIIRPVTDEQKDGNKYSADVYVLEAEKFKITEMPETI
ncbi:MAG: gamma carbonic anhydrase family protein, partial [Mogibacterium sp.]|nr:gamma carbonic anhydrase family protein [Mogibacterium sp.]